MLDSITLTELENYIKDHKDKINKYYIEKLQELKHYKPQNHLNKLAEKIYAENNIRKALEDNYRLGEAFIMAFVLECFYDKKYKLKDLKDYLKVMIDNDNTLKEYVYECMKDF
jgi:hypothetical protein